MNKFLFLLLLFPLISIGQIQEINSEELLGELIGQLKNGYGDPEVSLRNKDDRYVFTYRNRRFDHLTQYGTFQFKCSKDELDLFFNFLVSNLDSVSRKRRFIEKTLKIPTGILQLNFNRRLGNNYVQIMHTPKNIDGLEQLLPINKKQLIKLFGKQKSFSK